MIPNMALFGHDARWWETAVRIYNELHHAEIPVDLYDRLDPTAMEDLIVAHDVLRWWDQNPTYRDFVLPGKDDP